MSRSGFKTAIGSPNVIINKRISWLDEFAENIHTASKTAVEVARYRNELSLHDQINSIVSRQPTHATVADVVQEYHERTGLTKYLEMKRAEDNKLDKVAFSMGNYSDLLKDFPTIRDDVMNFAKNKIDTNYGQTSVPNIQSEILMQFRELQPQDVENEKMAKFISDLITKAQLETPSATFNSTNLGKDVGLNLDDAKEDNTDFYKPLLPNVD